VILCGKTVLKPRKPDLAVVMVHAVRQRGGPAIGSVERLSMKLKAEIEINWNRFIKELFYLASPFLEARQDLSHTRIAHEYALLLMQKEGGNKLIVEPAIILHDVGWSMLEPDDIGQAYGVRAKGERAKQLNRVHELEGASIARKLLQDMDYDISLIDQITLIIEQHDSGKQIHSIEEGLVKDSDKLWRFSRVGFKEEIERQDLDPKSRYRYLTDHYQTWFFTKTGRSLAEKELKERAMEEATNAPLKKIPFDSA